MDAGHRGARLSNTDAQLRADRAAISDVIIRDRFAPNEQSDNTFDTHAYYTHTLTRTPDGWKIGKVEQTVLWSTGNPRIHGAHRNEAA